MTRFARTLVVPLALLIVAPVDASKPIGKKAAERAKNLKAGIDKFRLSIWYCPERPGEHYNLTLSVPVAVQPPLCQ